jgi:hypothetical protein
VAAPAGDLFWSSRLGMEGGEDARVLGFFRAVFATYDSNK